MDSTKLLEKLGDQRAFEIFGRHDRLARDLLKRHGGREIDKTDGFLLLFERPIDAESYSLAYHQALADLSQQVGLDLQARAGIHLGEAFNVAESRMALGEIHLETGPTDGARSELASAATVFADSGRPDREAHARALLAEALQRGGDTDAAACEVERATDLAERSADPRLEARIPLSGARVAMAAAASEARQAGYGLIARRAEALLTPP